MKMFCKHMNSKNGERREISRNDGDAASFLEEAECKLRPALSCVSL